MACQHDDNIFYEAKYLQQIQIPDTPHAEIPSIERTYVCDTCGHRWTTHELTALTISEFLKDKKMLMAMRVRLGAIQDAINSPINPDAI